MTLQLEAIEKETIVDGSKPNSKIIKIAVEEMPTGEISAGAGIGTDGGSFSFSVKENNWLGKGVILAASADVSAESLKGALSFTDPNYNFTGKQLSYYIENIKNEKSDQGYDNSVFGAGIGLSYEKFKDIYFSPGLSLTYDDLTTDSSASDLIKKQAGSSTDLKFDYALITDKRDRRFMPTDGHVSKFFQELPVYSEQPHIKNKYTLRLRERNVWIQVYRFDYKGQDGAIIPIYFLDTDIEDNFDDDRIITQRLYSGFLVNSG